MGNGFLTALRTGQTLFSVLFVSFHLFSVSSIERIDIVFHIFLARRFWENCVIREKPNIFRENHLHWLMTSLVRRVDTLRFDSIANRFIFDSCDTSQTKSHSVYVFMRHGGWPCERWAWCWIFGRLVKLTMGIFFFGAMSCIFRYFGCGKCVCVCRVNAGIHPSGSQKYKGACD